MVLGIVFALFIYTNGKCFIAKLNSKLLKMILQISLKKCNNTFSINWKILAGRESPKQAAFKLFTLDFTA